MDLSFEPQPTAASAEAPRTPTNQPVRIRADICNAPARRLYDEIEPFAKLVDPRKKPGLVRQGKF